MYVKSGVRIGWWKPGYGNNAFNCVGYYTGPDLGDCLVGKSYTQKLMEGDIEFYVGVLFRPDLGRNQRLETILLLRKYIPQMFEYEGWEAATG